MVIKFKCPNGHPLSTTEDRAGKPGKCPKCGSAFTVPAAPAQPVAAAASAPAAPASALVAQAALAPAGGSPSAEAGLKIDFSQPHDEPATEHFEVPAGLEFLTGPAETFELKIDTGDRGGEKPAPKPPGKPAPPAPEKSPPPVDPPSAPIAKTIAPPLDLPDFTGLAETTDAAFPLEISTAPKPPAASPSGVSSPPAAAVPPPATPPAPSPAAPSPAAVSPAAVSPAAVSPAAVSPAAVSPAAPSPAASVKPPSAAPAEKPSAPKAPLPIPADHIVFLCPNGHKLNGPRRLQGRAGQCPHCQARFTIPNYDEAEEGPRLEDVEEIEEMSPPSEEPPLGDFFSGLTEPSDTTDDVEEIDDPEEFPQYEPGDEAEDELFEPEEVIETTSASHHPLAAIVTRLWRDKGGPLELVLRSGDTLLPQYFAPDLSHHDFAVFGLANDDGTYHIAVIPWSDVARLAVKKLKQLPKGLFE